MEFAFCLHVFDIYKYMDKESQYLPLAIDILNMDPRIIQAIGYKLDAATFIKNRMQQEYSYKVF